MSIQQNKVPPVGGGGGAITLGNAYEQLQHQPSESIHCCVTSPPYYGLRDYKIQPTQWPACSYKWFGRQVKQKAWLGCYGLEPTVDMFIAHTVLIFDEVRRVLRRDGTLWLNFGDSYAGSARSQDAAARKGLRLGGIKPKDLLGIPWLVAFALRESGWYLRQDIIWHKPNPMPESVTDRCTKAHEYIFLFAKSQKYYYDAEAIKQPLSESFLKDSRRITGSKDTNIKTGYEEHLAQNPKGPHRMYDKSVLRAGAPHREGQQQSGSDAAAEGARTGSNKRSVWTVTPKPFAEAHFATFPPDLITDCIKASCPATVCAQCGAPHAPLYSRVLKPTKKAAKTFVVDERDINADAQDQGSNRAKEGHKAGHAYETTSLGFAPTCKCPNTDTVGPNTLPGITLDLFTGSGTTALVAAKLQRRFVGYEINPGYLLIAENRLAKELGIFNNIQIIKPVLPVLPVGSQSRTEGRES